MNRAGWVRIIPFAVFMAFIGLHQFLQWLGDQGLIDISAQQLLYLYPVKALLVAVLLFFFWNEYDELHFSDYRQVGSTLGSILLGLLVFVLWINMEWDFATFGQNKGFDPYLNGDSSIAPC